MGRTKPYVVGHSTKLELEDEGDNGYIRMAKSIYRLRVDSMQSIEKYSHFNYDSNFLIELNCTKIFI